MRAIVASVLSLCLLSSCATNPVTGRTELNFISEEEEIRIGREGHEEILSEYAVYEEKPELNRLVDRIGRQIAAGSARPHLPWTFTLLDTPMINAMALPGGYIYVTRGILERMNSEDELAGVIGHEVAHVAARHSASSISKGTAAEIGLVLAAVLAGEERTETYGPLVMLGAGLLFTRYSRQQETQADLLGTEYMAKAGYNPSGSEQMLLALQRLEGGRVSGLERYFMDHPDPAKRVDDVRREIAAIQTAGASAELRPLERDAFVRALDGIVTGNGTLDTTIRDGVVYNRSHGLVARAPRGWKAVTEGGSVFAMYREDGEEVMYAQEITEADLEKHGSAHAVVRAGLEELGLEHLDSFSGRTGSGERLTIDLWSGESEGTEYEIASTQHETIAFLHIAPADKTHMGLDELLGEIEFDNEEVARIRPPRLRVRQARPNDTWTTLARRATGNAEDADDLAHINGFDFPSQVPANTLLKLPEQVAEPE